MGMPGLIICSNNSLLNFVFKLYHKTCEQFYRNFGLYEKSPNSFLPGLSHSIINQFRFHNFLCAVCGDRRVDDHQTEGGETVNQDVVVLAFEDIDDSLQDIFAVHRAVKSDFHAEQVVVRGDEVNAFSAADDPDMRIARLSHHIPVHDCCEADGEIFKIVHTERDGQTALRISIRDNICRGSFLRMA